MHFRTYINIEELDATNEFTPQSSEKSGDQEESDYPTFSGKVENIRQVLGEAIPKDTTPQVIGLTKPPLTCSVQQ